MQNNQTNNYIVILAGGKGERLWPLSRNKNPKQLLRFVDDKSLLEHTIDRVRGLVLKENLLIITTKDQEDAIKAVAGKQVGTILAEPTSRNTAPAIAYCCFYLFAKNKNAHITFIPADHYIKDSESFRTYLRSCMEENNKQEITLLGIKPKYAATGYGYIEYRKTKNSIDHFPVIHFHEKPDIKTAESYCKKNNFLWNIGIFSSAAHTFLTELQKINPGLYKSVDQFHVTKKGYENLPNISFDHAILEKSKQCRVMPIDLEWSDVGNLDTFLSHMNVDCNLISINARNNIITIDNKLVAIIGVENLCVVQTDDVLLIAKRADVEQVKQIVNELKKTDKHHYL